MVGIKQVVAKKVKKVHSIDKIIAQTNEILREYQDRNGELVYFLTIKLELFAIIQYDA